MGKTKGAKKPLRKLPKQTMAAMERDAEGEWRWASVRKLSSEAGIRALECPSQCTDEHLRLLSEFPTLEELIIEGSHRVTSKGMRNLERLPHLRSLTLDCCEGAMGGLVYAGRFPRLRKIALFWTATDKHVAELAQAEGLRNLELVECSRFTGRWLYRVGNLERLILQACNNLDDRGMESISKLSNLRVLELCKGRMRKRSLKLLERLENLEELDLSECSAKVTNGTLKSLSRLRRLRKLDLQGAKRVNDKGARCLASLTGLQGLNLAGTSVSSSALLDLGGTLGMVADLEQKRLIRQRSLAAPLDHEEHELWKAPANPLAACRFWSIYRFGSTLELRFGKIGQRGEERVVRCRTPDLARKELQFRMGTKLGAGYRKVDAQFRENQARRRYESETKTAFELRPTKEPRPEGWLCKSGGVPLFDQRWIDLWPTCPNQDCKRPMALRYQIAIPEVKEALNKTPGDLLIFFTCQNYHCWDEQFPTKTLFIKTSEVEQPLAQPPGPVLPEQWLELVRKIDAKSLWEILYDPDYEPLKIGTGTMERLTEGKNVFAIKVGGYPTWNQDYVRCTRTPVCGREPLECLLQCEAPVFGEFSKDGWLIVLRCPTCHQIRCLFQGG